MPLQRPAPIPRAARGPSTVQRTPAAHRPAAGGVAPSSVATSTAVQRAVSAVQRVKAGRGSPARSRRRRPAARAVSGPSGAARNFARRCTTATWGDVASARAPSRPPIAAAGDHHALAARSSRRRTCTARRRCLVGWRALQRRPVRPERAGAGGDQRLGAHHVALIRVQREGAGRARQPSTRRPSRRGAVNGAICSNSDQIAAWIAGGRGCRRSAFPDRARALAADLGQRVDQHAAELQHPQSNTANSPTGPAPTMATSVSKSASCETVFGSTRVVADFADTGKMTACASSAATTRSSCLTSRPPRRWPTQVAALARAATRSCWKATSARQDRLRRAAFLRAAPAIRLEVPSPSFTLVQTYERRGDGASFRPVAARRSGWADRTRLGRGARRLVLVEWPDRLGALRPPDALTISCARRRRGEPRGRRCGLAGPDRSGYLCSVKRSSTSSSRHGYCSQGGAIGTGRKLPRAISACTAGRARRPDGRTGPGRRAAVPAHRRALAA